jgi:hypothetical protein
MRRVHKDLQYGDIVVCRIGRGPGHVAIAGWDAWTFWHAQEGIGVCKASAHSLGIVEAVYRSCVKDSWRS